MDISIFLGWGGAKSLYILLYKQHAQVATCVSYNATQQTRNKNLHIYYTYINHFHYIEEVKDMEIIGTLILSLCKNEN